MSIEELIAASSLGTPEEARRIVERAKEIKAEGLRCLSCDHLTSIHQPDGCWYAVVDGAPGRNLVCPCSVAARDE